MLQFVWDARKAERNLTKHSVSFDEAKTVFFDPFAGTVDDPTHSDDDNRASSRVGLQRVAVS